MALIKIFRDGSFEAVAAGLPIPSRVTIDSKIAFEKASIKEVKAEIKARTKKLSPLKTIAALKIRIQHSPPSAKEGLRSKIAALRHTHDLSTRDTVMGMQRSITKLEGTVKKHEARIALYTRKLGELKERIAKRMADEKAKPKVKSPTLPKLDGGPKPRAKPKTAASFDAAAKRASRSMNVGLRGELRQHAKSVLVPVANKPGAQAAKVPVAKTNAAVKHPVKPGGAPIASTLAVIKQIKRDIAGGLTGAKLARARQELEKNRTALAALRAGKTPKNQAAIKKPGTAKHMGGAKKIVAKPSGMGDAATKPKAGAVLNHTVATLTEKLKRLRLKLKETNNKGQKVSLKRLIETTKERLAAMKAAK